jgi:hypothetical protein
MDWQNLRWIAVVLFLVLCCGAMSFMKRRSSREQRPSNKQ